MKRLSLFAFLFLAAFAKAHASTLNGTTATPAAPPYIGYKDAPSAAQAVTASSTTQLVSVYVPAPLVLTGLRFSSGVQSGNCQAGVYSSAGILLASSAESACPAVGAAAMSFTSPVSLSPGSYYLAVGAGNTTQTFGKSSGASIVGCSNFSANLPMANVTMPGTSTVNCFAIVGVVSGGVTQ